MNNAQKKELMYYSIFHKEGNASLILMFKQLTRGILSGTKT